MPSTHIITTVEQKPKVEEKEPEEDPGYYKGIQTNPQTKRINQVLICKYCNKQTTKLYNMKDHVHMHRG